MCDVSQVERALIASRKLTSVGARVIGAVVHGTKPTPTDTGPATWRFGLEVLSVFSFQ